MGNEFENSENNKEETSANTSSKTEDSSKSEVEPREEAKNIEKIAENKDETAKTEDKAEVVKEKEEPRLEQAPPIKTTFHDALEKNWFIDDAKPAIKHTIIQSKIKEQNVKNIIDPNKTVRVAKKLGILGMDSFMLGEVWMGLGRLMLTVFAVILALSPIFTSITKFITGINVDDNTTSFTAIWILAAVVGGISVCMWVISILSAKNRTRELNTMRFAEQVNSRGKLIYGIAVSDIVYIGLMAALVFVTTYFLRIPITTPDGSQTQLKVGNIVCLLAAILLGGIKGGFAAGIGSMLFDFTNPAFISSAPSTFINFFLMAYICGGVVYANNKELNIDGNKISVTYLTPTTSRITAACLISTMTYLVLYSTKTIINFMLLGSNFTAALSSASFKIYISLANALFATTVTSLIAKKVLEAWKKLKLKHGG